jgi:hypothetical protein
MLRLKYAQSRNILFKIVLMLQIKNYALTKVIEILRVHFELGFLDIKQLDLKKLLPLLTKTPGFDRLCCSTNLGVLVRQREYVLDFCQGAFEVE